MLNTDQLKHLVPSAFTQTPDPEVSSRYQYVSTLDFLDQAGKLGFHPVKAYQSRAKDMRYAEHKIILENPHLGLGNSEYTPTLNWTNSHNRSKRATCLFGVLRFACDNGLYIGTMYASMSYIHIQGQNIPHTDQIEQIMAQWPRIERTIARYQNIDLSLDSQLEYTKMALGLRYPEKRPTTYGLERLNESRRREDNFPTLWHTYNRVQEKLVQGWKPWNIKGIKSITTQESFDKKLEVLTANFAGIAH